MSQPADSALVVPPMFLPVFLASSFGDLALAEHRISALQDDEQAAHFERLADLVDEHRAIIRACAFGEPVPGPVLRAHTPDALYLLEQDAREHHDRTQAEHSAAVLRELESWAADHNLDT
jgi:hypothetical protein